ncbi:MAG: sulfotransferase [Thermodesulfobacteriota bacterium]|nr:sulfotransferase [Thermodesulfobacteriota bacterium]
MGIDQQDIYIHIGLHKTGSTFLQRHLFSRLDVNRIITPRVDYVAASEPFDPRVFQEILVSQGNFDGRDTTLISQETLSGRGDGNPVWDRNTIAQRLAHTFPRARIILVLRNQFDYILSLYTFRVIRRGLERRSLRSYLRDYCDSRLKPKLKYDELVQRYVSLFGQENVLVLPYEFLARDRVAYIQSILSFMSIGNAIDVPDIRVNRSSRSRTLLWMNRSLNIPVSLFMDAMASTGVISQRQHTTLAYHYFRIKRPVNRKLMSCLARESAPLQFDGKWRVRLRRVFRDGNRSLSRLTGIDFSDYGDPV